MLRVKPLSGDNDCDNSNKDKILTINKNNQVVVVIERIITE